LSRQPKLISKYVLEASLKQVVLGNYRLILEVSTLKIMNKTISNLAAKGITFSLADFHKYKLMETVSSIIAQSQMDLFLIKMKMAMLTPQNPKALSLPLQPIPIQPIPQTHQY